MAYIKAIACYVPPRVVTNDELQVQLSDCDVAKTAKGVGCSSRHIADINMTAGDMAVEAANKLFREHRISPCDFCDSDAGSFPASDSMHNSKQIRPADICWSF